MAISISLTVNGAPISASIDPNTLLVQFLRDQLRLTGTHIGCDTAQCGACTVHLNGRAIKSCNILAVQAEGATITTIEGLAKDGALHPMQAAFKHCHGLQCGFCTPGMMLTATAFLKENPKPTDEEIRWALSGNICRCPGYQNIVNAVHSAADKLAGEGR